MTQKATVDTTTVTPELLLVRDWEKYDDEETMVERPLPMWTLIDNNRTKVIVRGTVDPVYRRLKNLVQTCQVPTNAYVEYIYKTAKMTNPETDPEAVILPIRDLLNWLEATAVEIDNAKKMYAEEFREA